MLTEVLISIFDSKSELDLLALLLMSPTALPAFLQKVFSTQLLFEVFRKNFDKKFLAIHSTVGKLIESLGRLFRRTSLDRLAVGNSEKDNCPTLSSPLTFGLTKAGQTKYYLANTIYLLVDAAL